MSWHYKAGQTHNIEIANDCFKNKEKLKYLGIVEMDQYYIHKEDKSRLNSGKACYRSVQNLYLPISCIKTEGLKCCNLTGTNY
jgi:hypothetical protein